MTTASATSMVRRALGAGVLLGLIFAGPAAIAQPAAATSAAPVPVVDFFRGDQMSRPVLSPSGRHLAVQVALPGGRLSLAVLSVDPPREIKVVAGFTDTDIDEVQWVNDDRLVFTVDDRQSAWDRRHAPGLIAVDRDGADLRPLVQRDWQFITDASAARRRELPPNHQLLRVLRDGSSDVVVQRLNFDKNYHEVISVTPLRLDTRSGRTRPVTTGWPRPAMGWTIDAQGQARAMEASIDGRREVWGRASAEAEWTLIDQHPLHQTRSGNLLSLRVGVDDALYAVAGRGDGADTTALFRFDASQAQREPQPLVSIDGFDFQGQLVFDGRSRALIGVRYLGDALGTAWLTDEMKAVQARIDARLPGLINLVDLAECGCSRWLVVSSFSDRQPTTYWLYDREADRLEPVGRAQPQIDPQRMAERDFTRFAARDGLSIPLHVTRPAGPKPWPTVVLVHGGPQVRGGDWSWRAEAQFLASRGYLVLEPEFRGSTGFGQQLFRAGWKQWGLKSQDDIADAARWAIAQGEADPKRVCIAGASYGGYATLMGLIRDADLYRCGVAWAAVTDIGLMYDLNWSDLPEPWKQYGMPALIGDRVKDAEQLAATSPLRQAARLKRPLLMAIGGVDRRVPPEHGRRFRDALPPDLKGFEWVEYGDEGHGFLKLENRVDFWQRVERFLARELQPPGTAGR